MMAKRPRGERAGKKVVEIVSEPIGTDLDPLPYRRGQNRPNRLTKTQVLERDDYLCRYCGCRAETVDHVVPISAGGSNSKSNLVAACELCNREKAARRDIQPQGWKKARSAVRPTSFGNRA